MGLQSVWSGRGGSEVAVPNINAARVRVIIHPGFGFGPGNIDLYINNQRVEGFVTVDTTPIDVTYCFSQPAPVCCGQAGQPVCPWQRCQACSYDNSANVLITSVKAGGFNVVVGGIEVYLEAFTPAHLECDPATSVCVWVDGAGPNTCSRAGDSCSHLECQGGQCVSVNGPGVNAPGCQYPNQACTPVPPPQPPPPGPPGGPPPDLLQALMLPAIILVGVAGAIAATRLLGGERS